MNDLQRSFLRGRRAALAGNRQSLVLFESGHARTRNGSVDTTAESIDRLRAWIEADESLLSAFDPDSETAELLGIAGIPPARWRS